MERAVLHLLFLSAVTTGSAQRPPARSAPPTDSLRAAWTPVSIVVQQPPRPNSTAIIRFRNGQQFGTGLYDVTFLGTLLSGKAPYVVLSGRGCTGCDANVSIHIISPLGSRVADTTTAFDRSPGREIDRETGKVVRKSRMFIGHCLPDLNDGVIQYDSIAHPSGRWLYALSVAHVVADTVASDLHIPPPPIVETMRLSRSGECQEIAGTDQVGEP